MVGAVMSDTSSLERRNAQRLAVSIAVELSGQRGFSLHSTQDLSVGGAFFDRAIPLPVGAQVTVTLRLPGEAPIVCQGEVANVPEKSSFGMGVRFTRLSPADQKRLEAFLRTTVVSR